MNRIKNAAQKMNALIDDLFVYSLASRDLPKTDRVDLKELLQKVVEDLEIQIHEKQAVVRFDSLPVIEANGRQSNFFKTCSPTPLNIRSRMSHHVSALLPAGPVANNLADYLPMAAATNITG